MPIHHITSIEEFDNYLETTPNPYLLVDFYATWCGPCMRFSPTLESLSNKYPNVTFLKVDVDECQEISDRYKVTKLPTFYMFKKGDINPAYPVIHGAEKIRVEALLASTGTIQVNPDF